MFKIFRKKIQSLSQTQQNLITVILILFNLAVIIFWINFWLGLKKTPPPKITEKPKQEEISEPYKPGEVGEIKVKGETGQETPLVTPTLPLSIFSTTGVILEVKNDRVIVKGDGFNFADQKPRELTIIFTNSTLTFSKDQKMQYEGLAGLKYLKSGMEILIGSDENIRGKTEFKAKTINVL
jgi:hypothetical protein